MLDLVISGGTLADGTGAALRTGDLAIQDGRIVEVGGRITTPANRRIDADGALVTPGFIDAHSHYDGQITWDDKIDPSFSNGVTTAIAGNCGVGFAPARPADRDRLIALMEGVEAIPGIVLQEGVPWAWETFPQYLDFVAGRSYALDVAVLLPHAPLRVYAMGDRAIRHENATADDVEKMAGWVREAMAAGAMGVSSGRILEHRYGADRAYVPGSFAEKDELIALAGALGESGRGVFQVILKGTVGGIMEDPALSRAQRMGEHALVEALARASGRPVHYLLQQFDCDPQDWRMMLDATAKARGEGLDVFAHIAARGFGFLATLDGYHNFVARPAYQEIAHLPLAERAAAMREPSRRAAILGQADLTADQLPERTLAGVAQMLNGRAERGYLLDEALDYEPPPERSVGAIAAAQRKTPAEVTYDHLAAGDGRNLVAHMLFNYCDGNLDHVHEMLKAPGALASLGDGGAHMRLISDVSMIPFQLTFWARDRRRGPTHPLEAMVAKITRDNARAFGLTDRGELKVGQRADVNVIDFDRMKIEMPQMVRDLPAGGARLDQAASGFLATVLNGTVTRERDQDTGARPGRLVRP